MKSCIASAPQMPRPLTDVERLRLQDLTGILQQALRVYGIAFSILIILTGIASSAFNKGALLETLPQLPSQLCSCRDRVGILSAKPATSRQLASARLVPDVRSRADAGVESVHSPGRDRLPQVPEALQGGCRDLPPSLQWTLHLRHPLLGPTESQRWRGPLHWTLITTHSSLAGANAMPAFH